MSIAFQVIYLEKNQGLGNALKTALDHCSCELVARMDSDDISLPDRFRQQLELFRAFPDTDIVGTYISEFVGTPSNISGIRSVEAGDSEIKEDMKKRCPMNHVSVIYKKQSVEKAGGYLDWPWNEDYYLWIRMMEAGCVFRNVPEVLVNVRTGADMSARRGGWKYFKSEQGIQKYMLQHKLISLPRYWYNVLLRFGGEVLAPNWVRTKLFAVLRDHDPEAEPADKLPESERTGSARSGLPFSVAMSVYKNDNPEWFDLAMNSIIDQSEPPREIVLVVDGPIPETLQRVIDKYIGICEGEKL